MAATGGPNSPFAQAEQQGESPEQVQPVVVETVGAEGDPESYKITRSATGKNYVEVNDYDPLEHHRRKDAKANKGEGLGFMCCCMKPRVVEPGMDRHYSMDPAKSAETATA